jgi:hypothetical protein
MSAYAPTHAALHAPTLRALRPSDRLLVTTGARLTAWGERRAAAHTLRTARTAGLDAAADERAQAAVHLREGRTIV